MFKAAANYKMARKERIFIAFGLAGRSRNRMSTPANDFQRENASFTVELRSTTCRGSHSRPRGAACPDGIRPDSATLNEPGHLVAGLYNWQFTRFDLYRVNPPLTRVAAAWPLLAVDAKTDWSRYYDAVRGTPAYAIGEDFVAANGRALGLAVHAGALGMYSL